MVYENGAFTRSKLILKSEKENLHFAVTEVQFFFVFTEIQISFLVSVMYPVFVP